MLCTVIIGLCRCYALAQTARGYGREGLGGLGETFNGFEVLCAAGFWAALSAGSVAQTIYPLDRAELLAGSDFDLKVEFPGNPDPKSLKVTINGVDAATALGKAPWIIEQEEGQAHVAYWLCHIKLETAGKVIVEALSGNSGR